MTTTPATYSSYSETHPAHPKNKGTWEHRIWVVVAAANNTIIKRYRDELDPVHPIYDKLSIVQVKRLPREACYDCHQPLTPDNASLKYFYHPSLGGNNYITNVYWGCRDCPQAPNVPRYKIVTDPDGSSCVMPAADYRRRIRGKGKEIASDRGNRG